jgi:PAS domain S-box-containing protein
MSRVRGLLVFLLIFACYLAGGAFGLRWAVVPGAGSPVWPASGIGFAALVLFGLRYWPAVFLARITLALLNGSPQPLWAIILISSGTVLAMVVPILLIRWAWHFNPQLTNMSDMLALLLGGGALGATISAGVGAAVLSATGVAWPQVVAAGLNWWFGYAVGLIVLGPLILSWSRIERWRPARVAHFALCMSVGAVACAAIFLPPSSTALWPFHVFPFFVWGAVAFRARGVAGLMVIISIFAIIAAVNGTGPLVRPGISAGGRVFLTQQFIAMLGLTMLVLAAAIEQRRGVEAQARLAAIVASSPDAMISYTPDGVIRSWNKGAEALFGFREEEVVGRHGSFLLPADLAGGSVVERAIEEGVLRQDTARIDREGQRIAVSISANRIVAPDGTLIGVAAVMRDIRARRRAEEHQRLLINELNHRVKNTLAIVQGLAQQSFRAIESEGARGAFEGRLLALAAAHNLLTDQRWERAPLRELVAQVLAPYRGTGGSRVEIDGPPLDLDPKTAVAVAMALHELATNAAKYGALSTPDGHVAIRWSAEAGSPPRMRLCWTERGGPVVVPPARRGFGSRLIERGISADLHGSATLTFRPEGLECEIEAPLGPVAKPVAGMERIGGSLASSS